MTETPLFGAVTLDRSALTQCGDFNEAALEAVKKALRAEFDRRPYLRPPFYLRSPDKES